MANTLTTNPMIFDTAGATSAVTRRVKIQTIVWSGDAIATGDDLALHDAASGNEILLTTASANDHETVVTFPLGLTVKGLYLTTMTSNHGTLKIYTDQMAPQQ